MILVTGGTGFVGQEVVRKLLGLGYGVRLLVRHPQPATPFTSHPRVEIVRGDVLKPETLPAAMTGVRAVIHLIGIIAETRRVTFEQAHVEATRHVLTAARQAGVTRWIQMSALGTRQEARSRYHQTKWEAEELVRQSGLDWTIFRPSLIYGYDERDRLLNLLRTVLFFPLHGMPLFNGGGALVQPVSVREVAHCFAHAPSNEKSIGQTCDLVGPVSFSWREMVFKIARMMGRDSLYEGIPVFMLLRCLLWLTIVFLPLAIISGWMTNRVGLPEAEMAAALWVILILTAVRWNQVIVFSIPIGPFLMLSEMMSSFAPRHLQFGEQLKMVQEDNVGDPLPATKIFAYVPESFEEGASHLLKTA